MTDENFRSLDDIEAEYFVKHPNEIDAYVCEIFAEYASDRDTAALLSSLRVIAKVKGISNIADEVGITRQGLQKALSGKGNPRLENVSAIMYAMGYQLMPQKIERAVQTPPNLIITTTSNSIPLNTAQYRSIQNQNIKKALMLLPVLGLFVQGSIYLAITQM